MKLCNKAGRATSGVWYLWKINIEKPEVFGDVQILILASAQVVCSIVHASVRSYPQGSVCKEKKINFYLNYFCFNLEPWFWISFKDKEKKWVNNAKKKITKVSEFIKSNQTPYSCILFVNSIQEARYSSS
jgi:hypothetical protein